MEFEGLNFKINKDISPKERDHETRKNNDPNPVIFRIVKEIRTYIVFMKYLIEELERLKKFSQKT